MACSRYLGLNITEPLISFCDDPDPRQMHKIYLQSDLKLVSQDCEMYIYQRKLSLSS